MDFRLDPALENFLNPYKSKGGCYVIRRPGVSKLLLDDQSAPGVLNDIRIGVDNGVRHIMLVNHRDCGAYRGTHAFPSKEAERHKHEQDLREAAEVLRKEFPDVAVDVYFAESDDNGATFTVEPLREGISVH